MIIVEGSDGVGKTTLAKALQRELNSAYVHYGPLPLWWDRHAYVTRMVRHAVYDRYHWSCYAYKDVHPQPWDATPEKCADIDEMLDSVCGGKYARVLVFASEPSFFEEKPVDDLFTMVQIKEVNQNFIEVSHHFDVLWDVSTHGFPDPTLVLEMIRAAGIDPDGR